MSTKQEIPNFRSLYPRLLSFGVSYGDMERISRIATDWSSFAREMADLAEHWEKCGDKACTAGRVETPREQWRRAVDYYHYAQLRLPDSLLKESLRRSSRRCYQKLVSRVTPAPVRVEIHFQSVNLPGYLRVNHSGAPCVILIGGLDSSKEVELHYFAEVFLKRGCSVFYFDGPGQGELYGRASISGGFEKAIASVISFLHADSRIGSAPIGCFGVSFGGHLACRAAAAIPQISACISIGGFFDSRILAKLPPIAGAAVRKAFGMSSDDDLSELESHITLAPLHGEMKVPLLIVHGTNDHLVDMEQITEMQKWAHGPVETVILEGSEHVCSDRFNECLPRMGDWMTNWLMHRNSQSVAVI
jgi:2,6-dihydroxypseudooxynicotine hydrolase